MYRSTTTTPSPLELRKITVKSSRQKPIFQLTPRKGRPARLKPIHIRPRNDHTNLFQVQIYIYIYSYAYIQTLLGARNIDEWSSNTCGQF